MAFTLYLISAGAEARSGEKIRCKDRVTGPDRTGKQKEDKKDVFLNKFLIAERLQSTLVEHFQLIIFQIGLEVISMLGTLPIRPFPCQKSQMLLKRKT